LIQYDNAYRQRDDVNKILTTVQNRTLGSDSGGSQKF